MVARVPESSVSPLIVFAGGGTGGHLYPALAIADALRDRLPGARFLFFGTQRPIDRRILGQADCEMIPQPLSGIGRLPWRWPRAYLDLRRSRRLCRTRFAKDRPALVIGTGGLASVPAVREAHRSGIPSVLLNPDALPGRANRYLARFADIVFAQWHDTADHLPPSTHVVVSGCPVRPEFNHAVREAGADRFGLDVAAQTLLITGASQGARTINEVVVANLAFLRTLDAWQVLHLTGDRDYEQVRKAYSGQSLRVVVLPYTEHMAEALAAADLVIGRAGASFLAEITAIGRASILMPYPFHRDRHQFANAQCLARASAARVVEDRVDPELNGPSLRCALAELTADDATRSALASAAKRIGQAQAASTIADEIVDLAEARGTLRPVESLEPAC